MSTRHAALMRLGQKAMQGDPRAMGLLIKLAEQADEAAEAMVADEPIAVAAEDARLLELYRQRIRRELAAEATDTKEKTKDEDKEDK